jgi:hypothetical protein
VVFVNTPVGAMWAVTDTLGTEAGIEDSPAPYNLYIATAALKVNGTESDLNGVTAGTVLTTETKQIGALENSAAFTNTRETAEPMGILLNTLPYVGFILLALVAFALFAASKARKRERYEL